MTDFEKHFSLAKKQDRQAQKALFEMFSGKMIAVSKSYTGNLHDAEDVVMNAFFKCFTKISECRNSGSFPGWLRTMVVNDSISFIRKKKKILYVETEVESLEYFEDEDFTEEIDLKQVLQEMPEGYRLVFNLYVFEGKKHSEIAKILNISEGTSKSQLSKAKKWITEFLKISKNARQLD